MREIRIEGEVAYVPLTLGYVAVIDAADVPLVQGWSWHAKIRGCGENVKGVYALRNEPRGSARHMAYMHRVIAGTPEGMDTDHIDGDGLNNRRSNLRTATRSQNMRNRPKQENNKSGFKGVCWSKRDNKWRAYIQVGRKSIHLGYFDAIEDAASAYAKGSTQIHGAFGQTTTIRAAAEAQP